MPAVISEIVSVPGLENEIFVGINSIEVVPVL
jgi:hypothetical protein